MQQRARTQAVWVVWGSVVTKCHTKWAENGGIYTVRQKIAHLFALQ